MLASLEELVVVLDAEVVVVAVLDRVTSMSSLEPSIASPACRHQHVGCGTKGGIQ